MEFTVIDLFSGAGGVTTGIEQAEAEGVKVATVICAINHDELAIESHWRNHPHVKHFVEDIRTFNVKNLPTVPSDQFTKKFLWASLECTNHSNAKGGLSRDADSRTLAEHLQRYVKEFDPDYIGIENVREFKDWGPLIQKRDKQGNLLSETKGKNKGCPIMVPDKTKKGIDYKNWIDTMCSMGYQYEEKILNTADFGAHTSRRRLFILFAKEGLPIVWPEPSHDKYGRNGLPKWNPVKECLDFSDKGENIFGRKKNLSENTYKRIYAGLVKFIANGDESFLAQYNGGEERVLSTNGHCNTITTMNRFGLVQADFLINYHHSSKANDIEQPSPTLTTHDKLGLITAEHFIDMQHGSGKQNESVEEPCGSILPVVKKNLVTVERFIAKYYSSKDEKQSNALQSLDSPSGSLTTIPHESLVTVESFVDQQFGASKPISIEYPCNTLTVNPKYNLVQAFLYNPQYQSAGGSINDPCFTLIAKMNKRPPYLIQLETGELAIKIEETDTEYMRKIKMFMAQFGIVAIYMRMLRIQELKRITGLPEEYILEGTQADQKKFIGNAVPPAVVKAMFEALYNANQPDEEMRVAI